MSRLRKLFGAIFAASAAAVNPASAQITNEDLVPEWKPGIERNVNLLAERYNFYFDAKATIVVFSHGTGVLVESGKSDEETYDAAKTELSGFLKSHPDFNPVEMKDGNLLVQIPHLNVYSLVLKETMEINAAEIEINHQRAIPSHEVLVTPLGNNVFDRMGMNALFGRSFIFWDAQDLDPVEIIRPKAQKD